MRFCHDAQRADGGEMFANLNRPSQPATRQKPCARSSTNVKPKSRIPAKKSKTPAGSLRYGARSRAFSATKFKKAGGASTRRPLWGSGNYLQL
jgi:hypothetical protein